MSRRGYVEALAHFFEGGPYPEFADYGLTVGEAVRCEDEVLARAEQIKAEREAICPDCGGEPHFHFCGGERREGGTEIGE